MPATAQAAVVQSNVDSIVISFFSKVFALADDDVNGQFFCHFN